MPRQRSPHSRKQGRLLKPITPSAQAELSKLTLQEGDSDFKPFFDTLGFAEFTINDLRQLGNVKLQSNIDIFSNIHNRYSPGNVSYFAIDSGPLFDLQGQGKLRTAIGGEYVLQGPSPIDGHRTRQFEFDAGNVIFNYLPPGNAALQSVNLLVGYNNFRKSASFRSGPVIRLTAPILEEELLPASAVLLITPGYVLNGARQPFGTPLQPAHYNEANLDFITFTPLAENQLGSGRILRISVFSCLETSITATLLARAVPGAIFGSFLGSVSGY